MTKFQSAQIVSVALSLTLVLASWIATVNVPAQAQFAAAPAAVELA